MIWILAALVALYVIDLNIQGRVTAAQLADWIESGESVTVIDVRSKGEYEVAHVPGALHIPFVSAIWRAAEVRDGKKPLVVYCEHGPRASLARAALRLAGIGGVLSLEGHYSAWRNSELPTE
jgi:rhodanese-related sulfurtransferase